jgi:ferric iron reductase protein FhuF
MLSIVSDKPDAHAATLDDLFTGPLAAFAGRLAVEQGGVPASALTDRTVFDGLIGHFCRAYPGADRQAAASLWSQTYFGPLIVASVLTGLALNRILPASLNKTRIRFCPETGIPLCFLLDDFGYAAGTPEPVTGLAPLLDEHIGPLVDVIRCHTGLSCRLLWENAGWSLFWTLAEAVRLFPARRPDIEALLDDPSWPDGGRGFVAGMKRDMRDGFCVRSRRVCCQRYRLPGFGLCATICPRLGLAVNETGSLAQRSAQPERLPQLP